MRAFTFGKLSRERKKRQRVPKVHCLSLSRGLLSDGIPIVSGSVIRLNSHTGVISSCDWLPGGSQVVSASWDRTGLIHDVNTAQVISLLSGDTHSHSS